MINRAILLAVLLLTAIACQSTPPTADSSLDRLTEWMTGSFASTAHAAEDPDYHDIRLHMARIWPDRTDGYWLYVEQAVATRLDEPYRQRVYHLIEEETGSIRSEIYTLPDPSRFAGDWKRMRPLYEIAPDSLLARRGCDVVLRRTQTGSFTGGTEGEECRSILHGASYATSEVVVTSEYLESWDRGFNAEGEQVWGATKGGYKFRKISSR